MASESSALSPGEGQADAHEAPQRLSEIRIVLLGQRWSGKSSAGNTILGREEFDTEGETKECEKRQGEVAGRKITVVDTQGWGSSFIRADPKCVREEVVRSVSLCPPGPHTLLLVINLNSDTDWRSVKEHLELLSERVWRHTIVLFTWGDRLRETTIEQHIETGGKELQWLVEKCGNRYHVLNNKNRGSTQVTELLEKIEDMVAGNYGQYFTTNIKEINTELEKYIRQREEQRQRDTEELRQRLEEEWSRREEELKEKMRKTLKEEELEKETEEPRLPVKRRNSKDIIPPAMSEVEPRFQPRPSELRLVLLGRTGAGKSSAGNTLLGSTQFPSRPSLSAVTQTCERRRGEAAGKQLSVIDTPDLLDSRGRQRDVCLEVRRCLLLSSPGPHAFLLVLRARRFTDEEKGALLTVTEVFGEAVLNHTVVLFTHGDSLGQETVEQYIDTQGRDLQQLLESCGNRYHVLNNMDTGDRTQVTQLLEKIEDMVARNNRDFFVDQDAEERLRERENRYREEEEGRKEREEFLKKVHELREEYEAELRQKTEELRRRSEEEQRRRAEQLKEEHEEQQRRRLEELRRRQGEEQRRQLEALRREQEETLRRKEQELQLQYQEQRQRLEQEQCEKTEEIKLRYRTQHQELLRRYEEEQRSRAEQMELRYQEQHRRVQETILKLTEEQLRKVVETRTRCAERLRERMEAVKRELEEEQERKIEELRQQHRGQDRGEAQQRCEEGLWRKVDEIKQLYEERLQGRVQELEQQQQREMEEKRKEQEEEQRKREEELRRQLEEDRRQREQELELRKAEELRRVEELEQRYSLEEQSRLAELRLHYEERMREQGRQELQRQTEELKLRQQQREAELRQELEDEQRRRAEELRQQLEREHRQREQELEERYREQQREAQEERSRTEELRRQWEEGLREEYDRRLQRKEAEIQERWEGELQRRVKELQESSQPQSLEPGQMRSPGETPRPEIPAAARLLKLNIVLLGCEKAGKSSAGNTILGREEFDTEGVTEECEKRQGEVAGRKITVVDTPGWEWDNIKSTSEQVKQETVYSVSLCPPGPHALLLVIPLITLREKQRRVEKEHLELLSERVWRHTILLFTWGDELTDTTIEQHIERGGEELQWLVEKCGNRYHVLNNKNRGDRTQVTELLEKIEDMVAEMSVFPYMMDRKLLQKIEKRKSAKKMVDVEEEEERGAGRVPVRRRHSKEMEPPNLSGGEGGLSGL